MLTNLRMAVFTACLIMVLSAEGTYTWHISDNP